MGRKNQIIVFEKSHLLLNFGAQLRFPMLWLPVYDSSIVMETLHSSSGLPYLQGATKLVLSLLFSCNVSIELVDCCHGLHVTIQSVYVSYFGTWMVLYLKSILRRSDHCISLELSANLC